MAGVVGLRLAEPFAALEALIDPRVDPARRIAASPARQTVRAPA
jgi:hypothetical protein